MNKKESGFSMMEMLVAMTVILVVMGLAATLFGKAFGIKARESGRTDALTSAQAALNVISREVGNAGYGLMRMEGTTPKSDNGIVIADSNNKRLRIRSNFYNSNGNTADLGEDITYYYDASTSSIVRHDPKQGTATSYVVNRISDVTFEYFDYTGGSSVTAGSPVPTVNTGRVRITVEVVLDPVQGQPSGQRVKLSSDVTLRNSDYMINQY